VLVNPRLPVATAAVFQALECRDNPGMPDAVPALADAASLAAWLGGQRNDLEGAAMRVQPAVATVLAAFIGATGGCLLARMSGSGATCFGLYRGPEEAGAPPRGSRPSGRDWWVRSTEFGDQTARAVPVPA
jgi:4-diphosphocytidyl-2-C-methyl-D-erythritol kinase